LPVLLILPVLSKLAQIVVSILYTGDMEQEITRQPRQRGPKSKYLGIAKEVYDLYVVQGMTAKDIEKVFEGREPNVTRGSVDFILKLHERTKGDK